MTVIIADDSQAVRARLAAMLEEIPGLEILGQAGNVAGAMRLAQDFRPDAVVLDIRMPDGSGMAALRAIKRARPATTVIVLTNYPLPNYRRRCEEAGAEFFFDKSSEFEKVAEVLSQQARRFHRVNR